MQQQPFLSSISPLIPGGENLEKTVVFYEQKLGFKRIHQEGNPIYMAIVQRDSVQIFLLKKEAKQVAEETSLRISVNKIEQLYQELEARGEIIHPEGKLETKPWGVKEFVVLDPMGVCLTFCELVN